MEWLTGATRMSRARLLVGRGQRLCGSGVANLEPQCTQENVMLGFRGLHWIYEVTEHNNVIASRALAFEKLVERSAQLEGRRTNMCGIQSSAARRCVGSDEGQPLVAHAKEDGPAVANAEAAA